MYFVPGGPNTGTVWKQQDTKLPCYRCLLLDRPETGLSASISYQKLDNQRLTDIIVATEGCPAFIKGFTIPPNMKMMTRPIMKWPVPRLPATLSLSKKIMMEIGHTPNIVHLHIPELYYLWYTSMWNDTNTSHG